MFTIIINAVSKNENLGICLEMVKHNLDFIKDIIIIGKEISVDDYNVDFKYINTNGSMHLGKILNNILENIVSEEYICYIKSDVFFMPGFFKKVHKVLHEHIKIGLLMPSTNKSRESCWQIDLKADSLEELFILTEKINNTSEINIKNILRIDDFCIIFRYNDICNNLKFNEDMQSDFYVWQDFALKMQNDGKNNILLKNSFVCNMNNNVSSMICNGDEYIFLKQWGYEYKQLLGFNRMILQHLNDVKYPMDILHIGCKAGALMAEIQLQNEKHKISGLENNKNLYKMARNFGDIKLYELQDKRLPYEDNMFDCVIIDGFIESGMNVIDMINETKRVLRRDGFFIITALNIQYNGYLKQIIYDQIDFKRTIEYSNYLERYFSHNQICHLLQSAGLDIITITGKIGDIHDEFCNNIKNMKTPAVKEKFLQIERFIIKAYQSKRNIQFSLRKLEYNYDCIDNSLYIARELKKNYCSMEQLIFYFCKVVVYKDITVYNLLKNWHLKGEVDLIENFCNKYMEISELNKNMLVRILELILNDVERL